MDKRFTFAIDKLGQAVAGVISSGIFINVQGHELMGENQIGFDCHRRMGLLQIRPQSSMGIFIWKKGLPISRWLRAAHHCDRSNAPDNALLPNESSNQDSKQADHILSYRRRLTGCWKVFRDWV